MTKMPLNLHVRHLRSVQGLRREDLARKAKCSTEQIRRIEIGVSRPSVHLLERLIKALDMTPQEETRSWVLLAESYLSDRIRQHVDVHPQGAAERAADAAVEWVEQNLELPEGEEMFLRAHVEQRMNQ